MRCCRRPAARGGGLLASGPTVENPSHRRTACGPSTARVRRICPPPELGAAFGLQEHLKTPQVTRPCCPRLLLNRPACGQRHCTPAFGRGVRIRIHGPAQFLQRMLAGQVPAGGGARPFAALRPGTRASSQTRGQPTCHLWTSGATGQRTTQSVTAPETKERKSAKLAASRGVLAGPDVRKGPGVASEGAPARPAARCSP